MSALNHRAVTKAIRARKEELLDSLRKEVRTALYSVTPEQALTLRLLSGQAEVKRLQPAASIDYAGAIISFCQGKPFQDYTVDSAVTPVVMAVTERTIVSFFTSKELASDITKAILKELEQKASVPEIVRVELQKEQAWLRHEFATLDELPIATSISAELIDATASHLHDFFGSALGKSLMVGIGKILATGAGKILLYQGVQIAVAKVLASAAFKTALVGVVKKIGIGLLMKTAIGKVVVSVLAVFGLANIPLVWIILPLLAGFLYYEYRSFPSKLADRIPNEVADAVDSRFGELSTKVAKSATALIAGQIVNELSRVR